MESNIKYASGSQRLPKEENAKKGVKGTNREPMGLKEAKLTQTESSYSTLNSVLIYLNSIINTVTIIINVVIKIFLVQRLCEIECSMFFILSLKI